MSASDAVDGSSTGTRVPKMFALVKAPPIRRSYPCKRFRQLVSTSPSRFFRFTAWMLTVFPARPSHTEGNNCLFLALTLCGREAVQSQGTDEAFEKRADNARGRGLKVLSRKLAVTNSLLDNSFEYACKL